MLHIITSIFTLSLPQSRNKTHSHLMFLHQTAPSGFSLLRGSARFGGSSTALLSYLWYFVHAECLFIAREIHTFRGAILRDVINGLLIDAFRLQEARKLDSDFIISHWQKKKKCGVIGPRGGFFLLFKYSINNQQNLSTGSKVSDWLNAIKLSLRWITLCDWGCDGLTYIARWSVVADAGTRITRLL